MTKNVPLPEQTSHSSRREPAISAADEGALNDPIWSALNDRHRVFAWGNDLAMRYRNDIAPFAALRNSSPEAFAALEEIVAPGEQVALFSTKPRPTLRSFEVFQTLSCVQMVALNLSGDTSIRMETPTIVRLGRNDVPEMLQLTRLTNPGPFKERTLELGAYIGVRDRGILVAMAGERMQFAQYVEISAVCVHPDYRGKGYARLLLTTLMQEITERRMMPFLHVLAENTGAIALYESLGFVIRTACLIDVCQKSGDASQRPE
jgi:predicted GNAT family acetyltransferase